MGDPAQLNPVNGRKSLSFQVPDKTVLTQVVRQGVDSPLLEFVTAARYTVTKSNGSLMVKRQTSLRYACKKIPKEFVHNPHCFHILSWTNTQVNFHNRQVRTYLYRNNASRFIPGERLITRNPVIALDRKTAILSTSTKFKVVDVLVERHNNYDSWKLKVKTDEVIVRQIYISHEDEEQRFKQETQRLLRSAKRNTFLWKQYYKHLDQFANIRNCFTLTVHNSQGSTCL
jgi:hypothetical protein